MMKTKLIIIIIIANYFVIYTSFWTKFSKYHLPSLTFIVDETISKEIYSSNVYLFIYVTNTAEKNISVISKKILNKNKFVLF